MKKSHIKLKKEELKRINEIDDKITKQILKCKSDIRKGKTLIIKATKKKKQLKKRISHNLKVYKKILEELSNNNYMFGLFKYKNGNK